MGKQDEYEKRYKAIQLYRKGYGFNKILRVLPKSKGWLYKWLRRYKEDGLKGLKERSWAPKKIWRKTPDRLVKRILSLRAELESHRTRRSAFAGIGPEVIQWELRERKIRDIPSISTIARIISRYRKRPRARVKRSGNPQLYPSFKAEEMGDLQQTDLVGPRYLSGPKGVTRFYSFHTVDVAGHTAFTSQSYDKQPLSFCKHLVNAWKALGVPKRSQLDNEMAAAGGGRYRYSLSQVMRLHLLLGIHLVFIPQGEPGRNAAVESFNSIWQERVLHRHRCPTLHALRRTSERFLQYYHYQKPHRGLTQKENGTRFPGRLRDRTWRILKHLPRRFRLDRYQDPRGNLALPIAKGRISFIRKVDSHGRIEFNGFPYFIRKKLEGQYVIATILVHKKRLVVKYENRIIKSFPFPIKGSIIVSLGLSPNLKT